MEDRNFPVSAGMLLGLGLGGFFDGIVLHQLLQWPHAHKLRVSSQQRANLEINTLWDGIFHLSTYVFVLQALG